MSVATGQVLTFDGAMFARGWLSVVLAASKDKARPILNRTVHVEVYDGGCRLIATDSYILLRSWVPEAHTETPEPALDEAANARVIAHDPFGRGKTLLWHILNLTRGEDAEQFEMDVVVGDTEHDEAQAQAAFEGMAKEWVTFLVPDRERLKLPTIDGEFPDWRPLDQGFAAKSTKTIGLAPEVIKRLSDLERTAGASSLAWTFGGPEKAARLALPGVLPEVTGLVDAVVDAVNDGALGPDVTASAMHADRAVHGPEDPVASEGTHA